MATVIQGIADMDPAFAQLLQGEADREAALAAAPDAISAPRNLFGLNVGGKSQAYLAIGLAALGLVVLATPSGRRR